MEIEVVTLAGVTTYLVPFTGGQIVDAYFALQQPATRDLPGVAPVLEKLTPLARDFALKR